MFDAGKVSTTSNCIKFKEVHFYAPFRILLGHNVCKQGLLVDPTKIVIILSLSPPTNVKMLQAILGHIRYYRNFIKGYIVITAPMEKLLKKDGAFECNHKCKRSFDTLKATMASAPILVFLDWNKDFHIHINASSIALGVVLAKPREGDLDHPIAFTSRKLSFVEINYTTTEREGLSMVFVLQNFKCYMLGSHFKMFTNHSASQYLSNKPVLGGKIYRWLLLLQEFDFEIIVNLGGLNVAPNHLSRIEIGEEPTNIDDGLPDAQLFRVEIADDHYAPIISLLETGVALEDLPTTQKKQLIVKASDFQLIAR